jgi:hypothetical protein
MGTSNVTEPVTERRFPPPWSVEDIDAAFVVKDSAGAGAAHVYFEDAGPTLGSQYQAPHQRQSAADCIKYRQAAEAFVEAITREAEEDWR